MVRLASKHQLASHLKSPHSAPFPRVKCLGNSSCSFLLQVFFFQNIGRCVKNTMAAQLYSLQLHSQSNWVQDKCTNTRSTYCKPILQLSFSAVSLPQHALSCVNRIESHCIWWTCLYLTVYTSRDCRRLLFLLPSDVSEMLSRNVAPQEWVHKCLPEVRTSARHTHSLREQKTSCWFPLSLCVWCAHWGE